MTAGKCDPLAKRLARSGYRTALGLQTLISARRRRGAPKVFYGGARPGSGGGPLVKVARLNEYFPEDRWAYNTVYLLSNTPYLPRAALRRLKQRGVPTVLNQNGVFYPAWFGGNWRAKNQEMAAAYHLADHVFWQSSFSRRSADCFLGEREGPGEILFNAVDTTHFSPLPERPDRPVTFLVAGRFEHHLYPRIGDALDGLARLQHEGRDVALVIAGSMDDECRSRCRADVARLALEEVVILYGAYEQSGAPEVYQAADIYIMTKPNDPCPNTVIEALASGLPVIYSETGGVPELVGSDAGWPLSCDEDFDTMRWPGVDDLTAAMALAADGFAAAATAARERAVERYDLDRWIGRHRDVFASLLENR
ncbi:MAG: hypothetical protein CMM46_01645 [Rhodospirillaceae bacterium]|nr:hypothetical protein [Rhodospirillaceae bacterium]